MQTKAWCSLSVKGKAIYSSDDQIDNEDRLKSKLISSDAETSAWSCIWVKMFVKDV